MTDAFETLRAHVRDPGCGFSLGIFGAIAEFMRAPDEVAAIEEAPDGLSILTGKGGMRVRRDPAAVLVDYVMPSRHEEMRRPSAVLCLPQAQAAQPGRTAIAELGPDREALRDEDRDAILFDLGIGLSSTQACIRTAAPELIAVLRAAEGVPMFEAAGLMPAMLAHGPHRVFISALGRIEVFQPIPPPDGRSPEGPHTHVMPKLLAHKRTHAATVPVPDGYLPCLSIHPPGPPSAGCS